MDLEGPEMHYFIHNIYDAAVSLGVAGPDLVTHVGDAISIGIALDNVFNKRCSPAEQIVPGQGKELQSVCSDVGYVIHHHLLSALPTHLFFLSPSFAFLDEYLPR